MPQPRFDISAGRWYIRYYISPDVRKKQYLGKDLGRARPGKRPKTVPPEIALEARKYQDLDATGRKGAVPDDAAEMKVADFLAAYQKSHAMRRRPNTIRCLAQAVRRFLAYCEANKVVKMTAIKPAFCREYVESLASGGPDRARLAYNTIQNEKYMLCGAWSLAIHEGRLEKNPWNKLEIPGEDEGEETPCWTETEVKKLLGALEGIYRDIFLVGINSGFRCQAIRHMQWGWINWSPKNRRYGIVTVPKKWSKNGESYSVPLSLELHDVLARLRNEAGGATDDDLVFPGLCEDGGVNPRYFYKKVKQASEKAGVEWRGYAWHAMRSTFATRYLAQGISPRAVQSWMSHASLKMTDKYLDWSGEADDNEVDKLYGKVSPPKPPEGPPGPADDPTAGP